MMAGEAAARAIGARRAGVLARGIATAARAAFPGLLVEQEGTDVVISGRNLGQRRMDDPLLDKPALLAAAMLADGDRP